jgi:lipoyl(octanoyl) transferase
VSITVINLGTMAYGDALELQRAVANARIAGSITDDVLLLVEHPPVVTLGRGTKPGHLVGSTALLQARGVELFEVERGGDVTYHGPGQVVGYPIFDLKQHRRDLHWYLRQVEESIIRALAACGLPSGRNAGFTGVWTGGVTPPAAQAFSGDYRHGVSHPGSQEPPPVALNQRKIASIGVHARDWVTWHGFALNVTTDLSNFDLIVPCGISGVTMTTVQRELGHSFPGTPAVVEQVVAGFASVFERPVEHREPHWLDPILSAASAS